MIRQYSSLTLSFCAILALGLSGCGGESSDKPGTSGGAETSAPPATVEAGHAHPSEGPHGGSLIELGNEEYHAELVHDDAAGTVTIYLLDSAAKTSVPIEAIEIIINLTHDGQGEQFKIAAVGDQGDPTGKSSRFVSNDAELAKELDHEHAEAQLVVVIDGKQYRGAIEHHHGHDDEHSEGEDHAH
jgi:hypothetical protein